MNSSTGDDALITIAESVIGLHKMQHRPLHSQSLMLVIILDSQLTPLWAGRANHKRSQLFLKAHDNALCLVRCVIFELVPTMTNPSSLLPKTKHKNPSKKRVRREKVELDSLRIELRKLHTELVQLQALGMGSRGVFGEQCGVGATGMASKTDSTMQNYRLIAPRENRKRYVWQELAERQLKEKLRVLNRNRELREQLQAQYDLGRQLIALLHRQPNPKVSSTPLPIFVKDDDGVVKKHLSRAEDALAEITRVLQGPAYRDPTACFVDAHLKTSPCSNAFVMESNMTLPFAVHVTANAIWKVMGTDKLKNKCYKHRVVYKSKSVLSQAFAIHFITDAIDADFECKYTIRRFDGDGRVVVVWVSELDPIRINTEQYHNIRCHQIGWIELSNPEVVGVDITLARSYSSLTVDVDNDDAREKEPQKTALLDLALAAHEKVEAICSSLVQKELVEEDCEVHGLTSETA
ncbi:unnamed protein product [Phytophthora fragariaefolia]|uniref:Unnamed protein product n=1 Tax=Phytophthora fragariaefolia TaxID=1490495 RepID=A0A9W6Y6M8_9STRA|nr:unnamed protein product [Phytophthora fragariaefolia]